MKKILRGRVKPKYRPQMNSEEKAHKAHVLQQPCFGCGAQATQAHHTLLALPGKRWRRDHAWLMPLCAPCHTAIHDRFGNEAKWLESVGRTAEDAIEHMAYLHEVRVKYG